MTKLTHRTLFYSILLVIIISVLFAPGRFAAQASLPLAPTAPGHNIYFQAAGLPDGVTFNISGTRVNNGGNLAPYSTSFTTPNTSLAINADPGSVFTYTGYPSSLMVGGQYFELVSLIPTSPITVGVSGGSTYVVATYMVACQPPTITVDPVSQTVQVGDPVTFTLSATGTAPLSYEWYKDNGLIPDANQEYYQILAEEVNDTGMYQAVVHNACGTDTSDLAQLTVNRFDQVITFDQPLSPVTYGSTFWVTPTASSGLVVSLAASGSCTSSGNQVNMVAGTGECLLVANQAGNEVYNPAPEVVRSVDAAKADQAIDFAAPATPAEYGASFELEASASSGLAVEFEVQGVCELVGNTVSMTSGTGSCTITASQAGDDNYNAAADVERTVTAAKADQAIDFAAPATPVKYKTSFTVAPTSSSGLTVGLAVSGSCTNDGYTVTMVQTSGLCILTAYQAGNANYLPAESVSHQVEPAPNGNVIFIPLVFGD